MSDMLQVVEKQEMSEGGGEEIPKSSKNTSKDYLMFRNTIGRTAELLLRSYSIELL